MESKVCPNCARQGNGDPQPLSAFNLRDGRPRSWCRKCERADATRSYYKRPEEERRQYRRDYERTENGKAARARVVNKRITDGRELLRGRRKHFQAKFGISLEQYDELLLDQGGRCGICRTDNPSNRWGRFFIDHDHEGSGRVSVRGLLCFHCNTGLGYFFDSTKTIFAAITYLSRPLPLIDRSRSYPVKGLRDERLRWAYNITLDGFSDLLRRQGGVCAICRGLPHENSRGFSVDHIEGTKDIRGILCNACNVALGYFKDNPTNLAAAIWYLHKASQLEKVAA